MALMSQCLTSHAEMERCFSSHGVTAFADHDRTGFRDDDVVDDCADEGSYEVLNYAGQRYSHTGLFGHVTARQWATLIACRLLTIRRGNPAPESFEIEFARIMELLALIPSGKYKLFGLGERADLRPSMSNVVVDRRHRHSTIRVTRPNSTDAPTALSQDHQIEGPVAYD
jgi:hypothetical protein